MMESSSVQQRSNLSSKISLFGKTFQNIKSNFLGISLIFCLFSFSTFYSHNVQGQTYNGTYSFSSYSFNFSVVYSSPAPSTSALITVTFTTAIPPGLNPQLRLGPASGPFTFVNMTGSNPYSYNMTGGNCCPTVPFIFRFAYASGGLYESPLQNFPLPIILSDFSITKNGAKSALLTWETSSEVNSDYFGIERSTNGTSWDQISKLSAAGNSNTELKYNYIDTDFSNNRTSDKIFYYRLKLTDLDGSYKYSDIRGINLSTDFSNISVYPNPAIDRINIDLSGRNAELGNVKFMLYNYLGAEIMTKIITGSGIELIDLNHLPAATYQIVLKQGLETIHQSTILKVR
ncbi:MAG TPA: T9SS type A sorting domain-containing protein [Saprospiraceae bacterium]|nr:T9SS type A sorting domain-containing protein [Saprospiraceae bacterium]